MFNHVIPREDLLGHVRYGYDRLVEVRTVYERARQFRTG
jgi:hypothetical protein